MTPTAPRLRTVLLSAALAVTLAAPLIQSAQAAAPSAAAPTAAPAPISVAGPSGGAAHGDSAHGHVAHGSAGQDSPLPGGRPVLRRPAADDDRRAAGRRPRGHPHPRPGRAEPGL